MEAGAHIFVSICSAWIEWCIVTVNLDVYSIIKEGNHMRNFKLDRECILTEYNNVNFKDKEGFMAQLEEYINHIDASLCNERPAVYTAEVFRFIAENAPLAADKHNIFQDKICHGNVLLKIRGSRIRKMKEAFAEDTALVDAWDSHGINGAPSYDFGHSCADMNALLALGLPGIMDRIVKAKDELGSNITKEQEAFYESCQITYRAMATMARRLSELDGIDADNKICLKNISQAAPQTTYEALQLIYLYFVVFEFIHGGRLRTLGGLDRLLYPFYKKDMENGITVEYIENIFRYFLYKIWAAKVPYDLPFMLGGIYANGESAVNELSYLIVRVYSELDIYSPKIHIRVNDNTPKSFVLSVLESIKKGNNSFVFANDKVVIDSLMKVGVSEEDAKEYVFIGCYEPSAINEVPCTGAGLTNLAKILELTLNDGCDMVDGKRFAEPTPPVCDFDGFLEAYKNNIQTIVRQKMDITRNYESLYGVTHPFPIMSATMKRCVEQGKDAYDGGAEYNNSSITYMGLATVVDSLCAIKKFVFEEKRISLSELRSVLQNNWQGYEELQTAILKSEKKYGVNNAYANSLTAQLCRFCADLVNNQPNGRSGVFKAGLFSIDECYKYGKVTAATPDGRMSGEPLSKNLNAVTGMDIKGVTSLIGSAAQIDHSGYPNGTVLDFVVHPSAVNGEQGLDVLYSLILTYFSLGGMAIHGNILDADILKKAQASPKDYSTLQVRLCGWNVFFVDLSKEEQDDFIKQAGGCGG